jgi:hypothetical protein
LTKSGETSINETRMNQANYKPARGPRIRALFAFLAIGLVSWLAVFPLLSSLHLAFSSHQHRFCAAHQKFEDVLPEGYDHAEHHSQVPIDQVARLHAGYLYEVQDNHTECPFTNLITTNLAPSQVCDSISAPAEDGCCRYASQLDCAASLSILARAPKHSPPAQVS